MNLKEMTDQFRQFQLQRLQRQRKRLEKMPTFEDVHVQLGEANDFRADIWIIQGRAINIIPRDVNIRRVVITDQDILTYNDQGALTIFMYLVGEMANPRIIFNNTIEKNSFVFALRTFMQLSDLEENHGSDSRISIPL